MYCIINKKYICINCKEPFPVTDTEMLLLDNDLSRLVRICIIPPRAPSLFRRICNFSLAWVKHIIKGNPRCSQRQVRRRLAVCHSCELYSDGYCHLKSCGCSISDRDTYFSKLWWRDQHCPIN